MFLKSGFITVDIFAVSPVDEKTEGTRMVRRAGGEPPQATTTFAVGEEAEQSGPVSIRDVGQIAAPIDKAAPALPAGLHRPRGRRRAHAHDRPLLPRRHGRRLRRLARAAGQGRRRPRRLLERPGRGRRGGKGPVEEGAHFYRSYQLDGEGNPINKRNAWQARSVLYARLIPPGAADTAHFRMTIPKGARGPITLTAKLNYRKFAHYYTQFAYAGQPKPGQDDPALRARASISRKLSFDPANIPANVSGKIKGEIPDLPIITLATRQRN